VTASLRGLGERHVAEMYEVSERHVRRVLQEYRKSHRPLHKLDPSKVLRDTLDAYQALIEEAVALADEAEQESTRLGALKLRLALLDARLRMFPGIGLVPSEVERARLEADATRIARGMLIILDRHGVPEHVQQEIVDMAEGRLPPGPEPAYGETLDETSIAGDSVEPVDAAVALAGS
jgi:hypothetical protein